MAWLEALRGYPIKKNASVSCLMFADDLILVVNTAEKTQELLNATESYLDNLDMTIVHNKSACFQIV